MLTVTGATAGGRSRPALGEFQFAPAVAFDGTNYLVVWQEERTSSWDVYGARVSPAGTVLDQGGIVISTAPGNQYEPTVAFDGTNYLVTWCDSRSGTDNRDIYGARVSPAGSVLDPAGIAISTAAGAQTSPALAFDGTNYLVAWTSEGMPYGARVSRAGAVLDPAGIAIAPAAPDARDPSVAFDGTNYLVAWGERGYDIYGARVSPAGSVLDANRIAISTAVGFQFQEFPALAFDGTNYLVAWQADRCGCRNLDVYGARVSSAGAVLDPDGIPISTAGFTQKAPSVAFDGANYLVAWEDARSGLDWDAYGARVSPAGAVLDSNAIGISTVAGEDRTPALAFDGTNYLVAWEGYRFGYLIWGARVSRAGTVLDQEQIPIGAPPAPPPPPPPPPPSSPPPPPPPSARCKVPRVIGLRLSAARKRIWARHCALGRVQRVRSRRVGRVVRQNPKPGTVRRWGFPVKLIIGRRR